MVATAKAKKESKEVFWKIRVINSDKKSFGKSTSSQKHTEGNLDRSQRRRSVEVNQHHHLSHLKGLNHHGSQKDYLVRVSVTKKETFLNMISPLPKTHFPEIVSMHQLKHVHPLILKLFPKEKIGKFSLAGTLQYFFKNWNILTNGLKIYE